MGRQLRRWLPSLVVVLALSLTALAAAGPGLTGRDLPPRPPVGERVDSSPAAEVVLPTDPGGGTGEMPGSRSLAWAFWAYVVVFSALVAGILGYAVFHGARWLLTERVRRREIPGAASQPADATAEASEVRDALQAGMADLDAGGDPRRAVISCWLRLERIAAAAGSARLVADTPADLVARLLSRHLVSRPALEQLADAYRLARYAPAQIGESLLAVARRALHDVDAALRDAAMRGPDPAVREPVARWPEVRQ
jgi:hypothetical protein